MFNIVITPNAVNYKDLNFADPIGNLRFDNASTIIRCDNLDGFNFGCDAVNDPELHNFVLKEGFQFRNIDFETWVIVTSGFVESVVYRGRFLSMSNLAFTDFDKLCEKKKFVNCPKLNIRTSIDFIKAVDYNKGKRVTVNVVARYLLYRHELAHTETMKKAGIPTGMSDVAFEKFFNTASKVIRSMTPDHLIINKKAMAMEIYETLVTNSLNILRLIEKKRTKYSIICNISWDFWSQFS